MGANRNQAIRKAMQRYAIFADDNKIRTDFLAASKLYNTLVEQKASEKFLKRAREEMDKLTKQMKDYNIPLVATQINSDHSADKKEEKTVFSPF